MWNGVFNVANRWKPPGAPIELRRKQNLGLPDDANEHTVQQAQEERGRLLTEYNLPGNKDEYLSRYRVSADPSDDPDRLKALMHTFLSLKRPWERGPRAGEAGLSDVEAERQAYLLSAYEPPTPPRSRSASVSPSSSDSKANNKKRERSKSPESRNNKPKRLKNTPRVFPSIVLR
jgi:hypothetical protein